ncbi:MAG: hypothetical protein ACKV22_12390 [Bryobacteraceae bacterium]
MKEPRCTMCRHLERKAMEMALMEGTNCRVLARRYEVSKSALSQHRTEHLTRELAAGRTRTDDDAERQDELLQRLDWEGEGMKVMHGRHERKKPPVAWEAMTWP